jgi:tRNA dimethylallyltransferase
VRGVESLHRWLSRVDAPSGARIQPRDRKRLIRALEVYLLTGRALSGHFTETVSPLPEADVFTIGLQVPRAELAARVSHRVDNQFARGIVHEVEALIARGVPASAHAFSGLVYRQVLELLQGVRDETATRELIVRENLRYAKRQLTWFRKEPGVHWFDATDPDTHARAHALVDGFLAS